MCELFGLSGNILIKVNDHLKAFFSHSDLHPDGWGMAIFYDNAVNVEKEPETAYKSHYLKGRLRHPLEAQNMVAHIRRATRGTAEYENCHPFVKKDNFGRIWTLAHNGTIFNSSVLNDYIHAQEGSTDSELILFYLIDVINEKQSLLCRPLSKDERFEVIDKLVCELSPHNKLNLIIYDSEMFYIHTNCKNTLHMKSSFESCIFSTRPLDNGHWEDVPFTQLLGFENGFQTHAGTIHKNEYIETPKDLHLLFLNYANL